MAYQPCTSCKERYPGKATSVYSAWRNGDGMQRQVAKLCERCVHDSIAPYVKRAIERGNATGCDQCGSTGPDDYDMVYLTVYLPKREREDFLLTFCSEHESEMHGRLAHLSVRLPERQPQESSGQRTHGDDTGATPW